MSWKVHLAVEPLQGLKLFRFWPVGEKLRHGGREVLLRLWKSDLLVLEAPLHSGMDQHLEKKKVTKVTKDQGHQGDFEGCVTEVGDPSPSPRFRLSMETNRRMG